jgi:hypothetical protein
MAMIARLILLRTVVTACEALLPRVPDWIDQQVTSHQHQNKTKHSIVRLARTPLHTMPSKSSIGCECVTVNCGVLGASCRAHVGQRE